MQRISTLVEPETWQKLGELAKQENRSAGALLRDILEFGLKLYDPESTLGPALEEARRTFDDADSTQRALERALLHWLHDRQQNSIRGSQRRQEQTTTQILAVVTQTDARIAALEANMLSLLQQRELRRIADQGLD